MKITIEGVTIELTELQVNLIRKVKQERARQCISLSKVLRYYGFINKKDVDVEGNPIDWWEHEKYNWYAQIDNGNGYAEVWLTGRYLKSSPMFPGGWSYGEPKELADEIEKAIDFIKNREVSISI